MKKRYTYAAIISIYSVFFAIVWADFGASSYKILDNCLIVRPSYFAILLVFLISAMFCAAGFFYLEEFFSAFQGSLNYVNPWTQEKLSPLRTKAFCARSIFLCILCVSVAFFTLFSHVRMNGSLRPLMIRNASTLEIFYFRKQMQVKHHIFDRRCLKFVSLNDFDTFMPFLRKNGVFYFLQHVDYCVCTSLFSKVFIPLGSFPFNDSVLLHAIARGVVDSNKSSENLHAWVSVSG